MRRFFHLLYGSVELAVRKDLTTEVTENTEKTVEGKRGH
jgi:hypothetical protein